MVFRVVPPPPGLAPGPLDAYSIQSDLLNGTRYGARDFSDLWSGPDRVSS